jgi:hypothetical protein
VHVVLGNQTDRGHVLGGKGYVVKVNVILTVTLQKTTNKHQFNNNIGIVKGKEN